MSISKTVNPPSSISGKSLFLFLLVSLTVAALILDGVSGRLQQPWLSLTLPLGLSLLVTAAVGWRVVPLLRYLKTGQFIREEGPQTHFKKAGTPTMGGVFFIPAGVLTALIWSAFTSGLPEVIACSVLTLGLGFIGWLDDWQVLRRKSNQGISARLRLALELGGGLVLCTWLVTQQSEITTLNLPWTWTLALGPLFWLLGAFVVAAESNAVNLTDGLDGLAGGTCAIALLGLGAVVAPDWPGLMIFCACLSGSCLGFLVHNHNPARVFMGDTGSLALGGALAAVGLISNTLWILLILSGLFLVEALSVIAQVVYFKATKGPDGVGKRLFKMSPLHNHFELSGWPETQIVAVFYGAVGILACLALGLSSLD